MKASIAITIDTDTLGQLTDAYLCALWHMAQANPAPMEDRSAGQVAEYIGREIILRFLANTPPLLWERQGAHADWHALQVLKGDFLPAAPASEAQP